jgi:hypothetical protein
VPHYVGALTVNGTTYQLDQVSQWLAAGYTDGKMLSAIQQIMDTTAAAFPHQTLKLSIDLTSPALDGAGSTLALEALDYGYREYAGRFVGQLNYLSTHSPAATSPTLGQNASSLNYIYYLLEQHSGQVGFQLLASATDGPTNGYAENGGVAAPAAAVLQSALGTGLTYVPMFLEYWTTDAINPALDTVIQDATASMQASTTGTGTQVYAAPHGGYAAWSLDNSLAGIKFDPGIVGIDLYVPWNMGRPGLAATTGINWTPGSGRPTPPASPSRWCWRTAPPTPRPLC